MTRYRYTIFRRPAGEWRETRREAEDDVKAAGDGQYDHITRRFWCTFPADIEVDREDGR